MFLMLCPVLNFAQATQRAAKVIDEDQIDACLHGAAPSYRGLPPLRQDNGDSSASQYVAYFFFILRYLFIYLQLINELH